MSLEEKELTAENPCQKCRGFGYTNATRFKNREYFIICDRCYGRKNIDWVSSVVGIKFDDVLNFIWNLNETLFPGNFIMPAPGRYYIIREEFWYERDFKKKFANLVMTVKNPLKSGDTGHVASPSDCKSPV